MGYYILPFWDICIALFEGKLFFYSSVWTLQLLIYVYNIILHVPWEMAYIDAANLHQK
jgi:hypothetical protein